VFVAIDDWILGVDDTISPSFHTPVVPDIVTVLFLHPVCSVPCM
jgi:hypothetical protein